MAGLDLGNPVPGSRVETGVSSGIGKKDISKQIHSDSTLEMHTGAYTHSYPQQ